MVAPIVFPANVVNGTIELGGYADGFNQGEICRIQLSMSSLIRVSSGTRVTLRVPRIFHISSDDGTIRYSFSDPTAIPANLLWPLAMIDIGIGPGSVLLREAHSVSISRDPVNSTEVSVGLSLSMDAFVSRSCERGSAFRVRFDDDNCILFMISFRNESDSSHRMYETCFGTDINSPIVGTNSFMTMPSGIVSSLTDRIRHWGANWNDDRSGFTECDQSVLHYLPDIVLSIYNLAGSISGNIVFGARDYLNIDDVSETCSFRFRTSHEIGIDPLRLPFVNIYWTENEIVFCDPSFNSITR